MQERKRHCALYIICIGCLVFDIDRMDFNKFNSHVLKLSPYVMKGKEEICKIRIVLVFFFLSGLQRSHMQWVHWQPFHLHLLPSSLG